MQRFAPFVFGLLMCGTGAFAGPLNKGHVASDARWVFHVDVEQFVGSSLGQCILEHKDEIDMEGVDEINAALGIDVFHDVLSLTVYGALDDDDTGLDVDVDDKEVRLGAGASSAENAVAVLVMTDAADRVIEKLKEDDSYAEVRKDGFVLHSFVERESDKRQHVYLERGADAGQRLVVAGPEIEDVVRAIHVVKGDADNLTGEGGVLADVGPRGGSFVYGAGAEIAGWSDDDPASQILEKSCLLTFDAGQTGDEAYAALAVTANTDEDATNISQILQGLVALGRMVLANDPHTVDAMNLLKAIRFESRERMIVAALRYPADEACTMLVEHASDHEHVHEVHEHLHHHLHPHDHGDDEENGDEHGHSDDHGD